MHRTAPHRSRLTLQCYFFPPLTVIDVEQHLRRRRHRRRHTSSPFLTGFVYVSAAAAAIVIARRLSCRFDIYRGKDLLESTTALSPHRTAPTSKTTEPRCLSLPPSPSLVLCVTLQTHAHTVQTKQSSQVKVKAALEIVPTRLYLFNVLLLVACTVVSPSACPRLPRHLSSSSSY